MNPARPRKTLTQLRHDYISRVMHGKTRLPYEIQMEHDDKMMVDFTSAQGGQRMTVMFPHRLCRERASAPKNWNLHL